MRIVSAPDHVKPSNNLTAATLVREDSSAVWLLRNFSAARVFEFAEVDDLHVNSSMRWRTVACISLAANLGLLAAWVGSSRSPKVPSLETDLHAGADVVQTNLVVRRQHFSWRELESPDYATYIENLRFIGCPEQTIRDIIIADVNSMFAKRRATELVTWEQQWWRSEPDPAILQAALGKAESLERERRELLATLLGAGWEGGDMISLPRPSRPGVTLDGPLLGTMSTETKQAVQEINARSQDRMEKYLEEQQRLGLRADPAELAKLRQQTRKELAGVMSPPQLEEYLLRYSQTAYELRAELGALKYFNASPDEFRSVFRATDALDQRILSIAGTDANSVAARKALEDQREQALRQALGAKRYEEYRNLQDPLYRDAMEEALAAGTPEAAKTIYLANLAAEQEQAAINAATNYTASQKALAQRQLELERLTAAALASGQQVVPETPPMPPTPRRTYTIQPGDNLAVISLIYGVPVSALRQANPNFNFRNFRPGDTLVIPPTRLPPIGAP